MPLRLSGWDVGTSITHTHTARTHARVHTHGLDACSLNINQFSNAGCYNINNITLYIKLKQIFWNLSNNSHYTFTIKLYNIISNF